MPVMLGPYADDSQGADYVFHTASPFIRDVTDAKKQLIEPAVGGTENVLSSVAKHSKTIKRVVLTSSFAGRWSEVVLFCTAKHDYDPLTCDSSMLSSIMGG